MRTEQSRGFTLIELLVVVAIIALLASIILASLNTARAKSRDARRVADFREIQTALEEYYSDHNSYPVTGWEWYSTCVAWVGTSNWIPGLAPTYIPSLPTDPGMNAGANQNCYLYMSPGGTDYKLLDYAQTSDVDTAGEPSLVDPLRNAGRSWANNSPCAGGNGDSTATWAVWSDQNSECW